MTVGWSWGVQFFMTPGFWGICMALGAWLFVSSSSRVPHLGGLAVPFGGSWVPHFQGFWVGDQGHPGWVVQVVPGCPVQDGLWV